MNPFAWFTLLLFLSVLLVLAWPMGTWLAAIGLGQIPKKFGFLSPLFSLLSKLERAAYRLAGIDTNASMTWKNYALALLLFNTLGLLAVYGLQRMQLLLPFNPQGQTAVSPDSAFNTAVSFVTNTNWQAYAGESTMSYLTQMLALTVQNFFSAATGLAVAYALIRGFAARSASGLGNFWVDITRITVYLLLPLSLVFSVVLMGQGVIQNFDRYIEVSLIEPISYEQAKVGADGQALKDATDAPIMQTVQSNTQTLAMGPVASQEAIKMLGTNGGGFFNANSAHPFENPTPLSNFLQMLAIFVIPAGLCFAFGRMVGDPRQGWALLAAMTLLFTVMVILVLEAESQSNPLLSQLGADALSGNMEGKETRFGITASALFAAITTAASCGAVNAMHDSFMPLGGLIPMLLIQLSEVVFGGVGSGLYGMLIFAILAVFICGLMIGRTPEYLGKKIEAREMKMVALAILIPPALVLGGTAIALMFEAGTSSISNPGPHGLSQVLYAFSSAANNNGSAFAGLSANTTFYNLLLAIAMWFGRFGVIIPVLAIAGSLSNKKRLEVTAGTLPTHGPLFVALLIGTVLIVGALTYIPALALGPIVEHLQLFSSASTQ